jgi:hypothetical protein
MFSLKPRLKCHARPRGATLETNGITQNSLYTRDMWERCPPACDRIAISINPNRCVAGELPPSQHLIE